jgi:hypothetical protein
MRQLMNMRWMALLIAVTTAGALQSHAEVAFKKLPDSVQISIDGKPFARYVFRDPQISRPYMCDVMTRDGMQVTRNNPPKEGVDDTDHGTYHPGIFLAFGDISGADFWRNKGSVTHEKFVDGPKTDAIGGEFTVENRYASGGGTICFETCRIRIEALDGNPLIRWESTFTNPEKAFVFGDQEEMGLGIRVATPLAVKPSKVASSGGIILNHDGLENEKNAWGKVSLWCDYSNAFEGRRKGILIMPHPSNFRPSWFHARDYGVLVANPFGRNAFTEGEKSAVEVKPGERLTLRFGILIYCESEGAPVSLEDAYKTYSAESTQK